MKIDKPLDIAEFNRDMIAFLVRQTNILMDKNKYLEKEVRTLRHHVDYILDEIRRPNEHT